MPALGPVALSVLAATVIVGPLPKDGPRASNATATVSSVSNQTVVPGNLRWRPAPANPLPGKDITFTEAPMRRYIVNATTAIEEAAATHTSEQEVKRLPPFWPPILRHPPGGQEHGTQSSPTSEIEPVAAETGGSEFKRWEPFTPRPFPGHEVLVPPSGHGRRDEKAPETFEQEFMVDKSGRAAPHHHKRLPPFIPQPFPAHEIFLPPSGPGRRDESNGNLTSASSSDAAQTIVPSPTVAAQIESGLQHTISATTSVTNPILGSEDLVTPFPEHETAIDLDEAKQIDGRQLLYSNYVLYSESAWATECTGCLE